MASCGEEPPDPRTVDYMRLTIKPILSKRCYACHGGLQQKAGLRLDTAALDEKGGRQRFGDRARLERREPDHRRGHGRATAGACLRKARDRRFRPRRSADSRRGSTREPRALPTSFRSPTRGATGRFNRFGGRRCLLRALLGRRCEMGPEPDRRVPGRGASQAWAQATAGRRSGHADPPRVPRPDRAGAEPGGGPRVRGRSQRSSLRGTRRPAARQSRIRRALGAALDGRLALQRLGRLRRRGPREPASHLAMARLDRRVAQSRPALRPHDRRHAGRR